MLRVDFQGHRRESRGGHRHISLTNSTVLGVYRGDFDMVLANQTEALVFRCSSHPDGSDRGISDGYVVHLSLSLSLSLSGRCGAAVVKIGLGSFCFVVLYLPPKPCGRGEATPWR